MTKRLTHTCVLAVALLLAACGGNSGRTHRFAGTFTDEFGDRFVLNDDYTGTIQFDKNDHADSITWSDGSDHSRPYATIKYNGDPNYYYLRDGALYRHKDNMESGRCAIKISYAD